MKVIIAGSRTITDRTLVEHVIKTAIEKSNNKLVITEVVCGMCEGPDLLGKDWADKNKIPVKEMPAKWYIDGMLDRSAGFKRNVEMANYGEALIAIIENNSNGTSHMISEAKKRGLNRFVYKLNRNNHGNTIG